MGSPADKKHQLGSSHSSKKHEQVLGIVFIIHVINIIFYLATSKFDL